MATGRDEESKVSGVEKAAKAIVPGKSRKARKIVKAAVVLAAVGLAARAISKRMKGGTGKSKARTSSAKRTVKRKAKAKAKPRAAAKRSTRGGRKAASRAR